MEKENLTNRMSALEEVVCLPKIGRPSLGCTNSYPRKRTHHSCPVDSDLYMIYISMS